MPRKKKERAVSPLESSESTELTLYQSPVSQYDGTLDSLADLAKNPDESPSETRWRLITLMRGDRDMERFIEAADASSGRKGRMPSLDFIAEKSGVQRSHVVGAIARALHDNNFHYARIISALAMPKVAHTLSELAALPTIDAHRDRQLFMKSQGLLPTSSQNINVNTSVVAQSRSENVVAIEERRRLPRFEDQVRETAITIRDV